MAIFNIPAACLDCGLIFKSGFTFSLFTNVQLSGNVSQCPRCKSMAPVPDGIMRAVKNGIQLLSGPDFTAEMLKKVGILAADLRSGKVSANQAASIATDIHPSFGKHFREVTGWGAQILGCFIALWMAVVQWHDRPGQNTTVDEAAIDAFESGYEQQQPVIRQTPRFLQQHDVAKQGDDQAPNRKLRRAQGAKQRLIRH